ncbi:MAG: NAD(+)/NADH kinase [Clostridiales bacterium]|nr:NAD(+)/NADH kinase [Clostridiales bacterium]
MKKVYMVMHQHKPNMIELLKTIVRTFNEADIQVSCEPWLLKCLDSDLASLFCGDPPFACEAIVSVGGDGTLLRANILSTEHNIPLLGINVGTIGFLAEVELDQLEIACKLLRNDEYTLDARMMLKAVVNGSTFLALNDVVLSRGGYTRLIGLNAWVDADHIGRFIADGLIVSTPTGSTGYSLSAGGPIIHPAVDCMLITPICAHSLQHRPVVAAASQCITVKLDKDHNTKAMISIDGQKMFELGEGQVLTITRSERRTRFIRFEPKSFFSKIRIKLSEWSC